MKRNFYNYFLTLSTLLLIGFANSSANSIATLFQIPQEQSCEITQASEDFSIPNFEEEVKNNLGAENSEKLFIYLIDCFEFEEDLHRGRQLSEYDTHYFSSFQAKVLRCLLEDNPQRNLQLNAVGFYPLSKIYLKHQVLLI